MEPIKIIVENSLSTKKFDEGFRIHQREYDKVTKLIDDQINNAGKYGKSIKTGITGEVSRFYSTISVFGERGVGKTSFLLSLREKYKDENRVEVLPIVDPTLIEEKGHVFLLLVSIIDDLIMKRFDERDEKAKEDDEKRQIAKDKDEWQRWKNKIAKGLPSLDHVGLTYEEPQWQQDEYVMTKGLQSVSTAFNLERNFHLMVNYALHLLGGDKKAFLLMFDDIDVDFKKGWKVLETIRKYLTTPQIVIVLSGNMKLYSKNVRKQQWLNLGKALLKNEADRDKNSAMEYNRLVNELEGQYLLKILKSENRVYLHGIYENINTYGIDYQIITGDNIPQSIKDYYNDVFNKYGIWSRSVVDLYTNFMLNTSVRTQMHFLINAVPAKGESLLSTINAFLSRIYAQGVDIDLATNEKNYNVVLLHYLVEHEVVEEAYQLLPNFDNTDTNSAMAGFNFIFAQLMARTPSLIFDYWIRVSCTRDVMSMLEYDSKVQNSAYKYCLSSGAFRARGLRSIVGNGFAFMKYAQKNYSGFGNVELLGFAKIAKKGMLNEQFVRIDTALENQGLCQLWGYLPLISLASSYRNSHQLVFSLYGLLANIGELLSTDGVDMSEALAEAAQPRSFQLQMGGADIDDSRNNDVAIGDDVTFEVRSLNLLAHYVTKWKEQYSELGLLYGAHLFGRISTRLYFALRSIANANRNRRLGDTMNIMVMALFNASLIEETKERYSSGLGGLNINNIVSSSKILNDNVVFVTMDENIRGRLPFTKWLMSCPLLYPYMREITSIKMSHFVPKESLIGYQDMADDISELTEILNRISVKTTARISFSFAKDKKEKTIEYINNSLDVETVYNAESLQDAVNELSSIFIKPTTANVNTIRKECEIVNGKLVLRQNQ